MFFPSTPFERFTDRARKVMSLAQEVARNFNHECVSTEHILLGFVKEGSGVGVEVLKRLKIDLRIIRSEVEKLMKIEPEQVTMGRLPETPRAKKVIEYAIEEARDMNGNYVGTEHLLLGLLRECDGVAAQVLMNLGLNLEDVREKVLEVLGKLEMVATPPHGEGDELLLGGETEISGVEELALEELALGEDITEEDEEDPDSHVEILADFFSGLEVLAREALDRLSKLN